MPPSGGPPCPDPWRAAFIGEPTWVSLSPGERLYKFVSLPVARDRVLTSPWWIRQSAFDEMRRRAPHLGVRPADLARSRMAIAHEWNPGMDTVYIVALARQADGWEGRARSQPLTTASREVVFTGGGQQLCVPGLTWQHIGYGYSGSLIA